MIQHDDERIETGAIHGVAFSSRNRRHAARRFADALKRSLLDQRKELAEEWEHGKRELRTSEPKQFGPDLFICSVSDSFTTSTMDHLAQEIREVDAALARLADGKYGICESCRRSIASGRLRAIPTAKRCISCQRRAEKGAA
jgi:RNA polymerase-binding transcription factor DksA